MRVRISYSVELEDVPGECARMLEESIEKISEVHKNIESLVDKLGDKDNVGWQITDQIDRCRRKLAELDMVLEDNNAILDGYYQTKNKEENEDVASEG